MQISVSLENLQNTKLQNTQFVVCDYKIVTFYTKISLQK